jgi:hypothetical protein
VAGALADAYGPAAAFSVAPAAALLAFLLTLPAHHDQTRSFRRVRTWR